MAKYKVGDEVWVKETIKDIDIKSWEYYMDCSENAGWFGEKDILGKVDETMTAEEAWKIAGKIARMEDSDIEEHILGGSAMHPLKAALWNLEPQEAKSKIEAWEAEREIKVGDVVKSIYDSGVEVMITKCYYYDGKHYDGINASGAVYSGMHHKDWKKTGRHIDIQGVLGQIGGVVE